MTIAHISKAEGSIVVTRAGQDITVRQGDTLYEGDIVKTDLHSVELSFADGSMATLSPKTVMNIEDFAYSSGGVGSEAPSFVMELVTGAMRTISGAVVEQNPDAFKLVTPRATVGIRGTTFLAILNPDGSETVIVIGLDAGHNLVVTTHTGSQVSMGEGNQGVTLGAAADAALVPRVFSAQEINDIVQNIIHSLSLSDDDDEHRAQEEEHSDGSDQTTILLDAAALGEGNAEALAEALQDIGIDILIVTDNPDPLDLAGPSSKDEYYEERHESEHDSMGHIEISGSENFFADAHDDITEDFDARVHYISVEGDTNTAVIISGDINSMSDGTVHAGNDTILGKNMSDGTLVGDALLMTGGSLIAGNDTLSVINKTGGQSIYGDVKDIRASTGFVAFGDDTITVNGNFYNSVISGDTAFVSQSSGGLLIGRWGNDNITVTGNMGETSATTTIYGDAAGAETAGGNDTITVEGSMQGNSTAIYAGGGDDVVRVTVMSGGLVDAGSGNDKVFVDAFHENSVLIVGSGADEVTIQETSTGSALIDVGLDSDHDSINLHGSGSVVVKNFHVAYDKLFVNGAVYSVVGSGTYGDYTVTFESLLGYNASPTLTLDNDGALNVPAADKTASGGLTATDPEGESLSFGLSAPDSGGQMADFLTGAYGSLSIDPDTGDYTYTTDTTAMQPLGEGQLDTETFSIYVKDAAGAYTQQTLTVTVTGVNDAPVIDAAASDVNVTLAETAAATSGKIVATDVDENEALTYTVTASPTASLGSFSIDSNGEYTFTLDSAKADSLAAGVTVTEVYEITVSDGKGGSVIQEVEVNIMGANDAPTLSVAMTDNSVTFGTDTTASGALTFGDVDSDGSTGTVNNEALGGADGTSAITITGTYGDLVVNADGTFTYTSGVTDAQLAALRNIGAGTSVTESFQVRNTDPHGLQASDTINITVNGTENLPVLAFTENSVTPDDGNITIMEGVTAPSVTISATDGNTGTELYAPAFTVSATENSVATGVGGAGVVTTYGTVQLIQNGSAIQYVYNVDSNDADTQALLPGQIVTDTFYIHVVDALGQKTLHKVSVEIHADGNFSYTGTAADDALTIQGDWSSGTITGNGGNDSFTLQNSMTAGTITTTDGDDSINVKYMFGGSVDVGEGVNTLIFDAVSGASAAAVTTVTAGAGVDNFTTDSLSSYANVNLGAGNNVINVGIANGNTTTLTTLGGDDTLTVNSNVTGVGGSTTINLGDGVNNVHIKGFIAGDVTLTTGADNDTVTVDGDLTGHINVGDGTNSVTVGNMPIQAGGTTGSITGGAGDDTFEVKGSMAQGSITTGGGNNEVTVGSMSGTLTEIRGDTGVDTVTVTGNLAGMAKIFTGTGGGTVNIGSMIDNTSITGNSGADIITITDMKAGTITTGAGADTITVGGTTVSGTIDLANGATNDTDSDKVYLTAGSAGTLTIANFNASQDVLYYNNSAWNFTAADLTLSGPSHILSGNNYTITFNNLSGVKPALAFTENSGTANDGSIEHTEGGNPTPVAISAMALDGSATLYAIGGDTSASPPTDEPDKQGVGSAVAGDYGDLTLNSAGDGYTYMANATSSLTPGQVVTDTFTIYAVDASNAWTAKVVTVTVIGDHNFTGTGAADTWTVAGILETGTIIGNGGNDTFTLGGMEGGGITTGDNDDSVTIAGTVNSANISLGDGIDTLLVDGAISDSTINVGGGTNNVTLKGAIAGDAMTINVSGTSTTTLNLADTSGAVETLNMSLESATADTHVFIFGGMATDIYKFTTTGAASTTVTIVGAQNAIDFTEFYVNNSKQSISASPLIVDNVTFEFENGMSAASLRTTDTLPNSGFTIKNHIVGVGNNTLIISDLTSLDYIVLGDAENVPTAAAAGSDTIILMGDFSTGQGIYGDVYDTKDGSVSTADTLTVDGNFTAGRLYGDAGNVGSDDGVTGSTATITISGHDTLTVYGNMTQDSSYFTNIFGDVSGVDIDSGDNPNEKATVSGNDIITVYGTLSGGNIFGDLETVFSNDYGDTSSVLISGSDTITIHGGMTGGAIYGDGKGVDALTVTGADIITIHGGMSGGVISGDVDDASNISIQGHDTINIYGNMTGSSIIYGDTRRLPSGSSEGNDSITVHGNMSSATIYGDADNFGTNDNTKGDDKITIKGDMDSASIIYGDARSVSAYPADKTPTGHDNITVEGNMTGGSVIYGDAQTMSASAGAGSVSFTGHDTITVHGNMTNAKIYGDAQELLGNATTTGDDTITIKGVMGGTAADTLIDAGAGADTISIGAADKGATGGTITGGAGNDSITVFVGDTGSKGNLIIDASGMSFTDESITLHDAGSGTTHVSITNLSNTQDYAAGTFTVDGTDITSHVNSALDTGSESWKQGDLVIYFK